jgi:hypothetical protein
MPVLPLVGSKMIVSGLIRRVDHGHADAVLHAARRVEGLQLGRHLRHGPGGHPAQPDQRRVPDQLRDVLGDSHRSSPRLAAAVGGF